MSKNIVINGATYTGVDEIQIPKSGGGYATFVDASNLTTRLNIAQIFSNTATEINDVNGEVNGTLSTRVTNNNTVVQSIILPAATSVAYQGLYGCTNLVYLKMDACTSIGQQGLKNCSRLQEIDMPSLLTTNMDAIYGCTSLVSVELPSLTTLGQGTFMGCYSLRNITLPKVTSMGDYVFRDTPADKIIIGSQSNSVCSISGNTFYSTKIASGTGYVYVPDALLNDYKTANRWSNYANQIKGLSELPS